MGNPSEERMEVYKKSCEKIVENESTCCTCVRCVNCPFFKDNNGYDKGCVDLGASAGGYRWDEDPILVDNAQKFLDGIITFHEGKLVEVVDE